jgi:PST family polysaccharide transporter
MNVKRQFKNIKKNFIALTLIQGVNIISPLILIPLYIKYLSIDTYGLYALSMAISAFAQIIISYGFNFTANRSLAISKTEKESQKIISLVRTTQFSLFILCLFFFPLIGHMFAKGNLFTFLVFLNVFSYSHQLLFPQWLYHGLNDITTLKNISFVQKLILTALAVVLIPIFKKVELIPFIIIISSILTYFSFRLLNIIKIQHRFYIVNMTFSNIIEELKKGYSIFISQLVSQVYSYSPKIILGLYLPLSSIALFDVAEKVLKITKIPQYMLVQAFFPVLSKEYKKKLKRTFEYGSLFFSIILVLFFLQFSNLIFDFFLRDVKPNLLFFKVMSFSLIFVFLSSYNGPLGLVVLKKDSLWTRSTLYGLYVYVALVLILMFSKSISLLNFAYVIVFSELIVYLTSKKFLNNVQA